MEIDSLNRTCIISDNLHQLVGCTKWSAADDRLEEGWKTKKVLGPKKTFAVDDRLKEG